MLTRCVAILQVDVKTEHSNIFSATHETFSLASMDIDWRYWRPLLVDAASFSFSLYHRSLAQKQEMHSDQHETPKPKRVPTTIIPVQMGHQAARHYLQRTTDAQLLSFSILSTLHDPLGVAAGAHRWHIVDTLLMRRQVGLELETADTLGEAAGAQRWHIVDTLLLCTDCWTCSDSSLDRAEARDEKGGARAAERSEATRSEKRSEAKRNEAKRNEQEETKRGKRSRGGSSGTKRGKADRNETRTRREGRSPAKASEDEAKAKATERSETKRADA